MINCQDHCMKLIHLIHFFLSSGFIHNCLANPVASGCDGGFTISMIINLKAASGVNEPKSASEQHRYIFR